VGGVVRGLGDAVGGPTCAGGLDTVGGEDWAGGSDIRGAVSDDEFDVGVLECAGDRGCETGGATEEPKLLEADPTFRNPSLTSTLPPTPIPANVVVPPLVEPSLMVNSRPRTLRTASIPLRPKMFNCPFDSCSKCNRSSVKVAVGGNVPVNRIGGSEHCSARVIGLDAKFVSTALDQTNLLKLLSCRYPIWHQQAS